MTTKQIAFLKAMLEQGTISKAADVAGIARDTAYRYLRNPAFQAELTKCRSECIKDTVHFLQGKLTFCSEVLIKIVEKPDTSDQVKINAINAIFMHCKSMTETTEIITRIEQIEGLIESGEEK